MKNDLMRIDGNVFRVLEEQDERVLVIDCQKKAMPFYRMRSEISAGECVPEAVLSPVRSTEELSPQEREIALKRYSMIAAALMVLSDTQKRQAMISDASVRYDVSKQTLRSYLWQYLVYQEIAALAPKKKEKDSELSGDQKNMRWALNRFFYTRNRNSLRTAYTMMLKERYCDTAGSLFAVYPSFNQFRYFYRKTRKLENYYITRDGLTHYQRNNRPLTGNGVQSFAPAIGTAMLDGTVCDIYLADEAGQIVGRPLLVVATDANTSFCMGFSLLWEGGTYSLRELMLNIISDKVELCRSMGISITEDQWNIRQLPGKLVTDGGSEYVGKTFEQISELGIILENLPPYRAELKGPVEKLFDLVQNSYKDILKGKGVIMPDFQERGAHDYRKDACLTLRDFERIVAKCILYYNNNRIIENYPYTPEMLKAKVRPYASSLWNWKLREECSNLISVSAHDLSLTLLPRTTGRFSRFGLKVNNLRYFAEGYKERFLKGGECTVAYNPDNCGKVWLRNKDGRYAEFSLIESRFDSMSLDDVKELRKQLKEIVQAEAEENLQARIELMNFIEAVANRQKSPVSNSVKGIRTARTAARRKAHKDIGGNIDD